MCLFRIEDEDWPGDKKRRQPSGAEWPLTDSRTQGPGSYHNLKELNLANNLKETESGLFPRSCRLRDQQL